MQKQFRYALDQLRLLIAEELIAYAMKIAPKSHPDTIAIVWAAVVVAKRTPSD